MKQLKIFHENWFEDERLDDVVNKWIKEMGDDISLVDIRVNATVAGKSLMPYREAYIIYETKEESDDKIRP